MTSFDSFTCAFSAHATQVEETLHQILFRDEIRILSCSRSFNSAGVELEENADSTI